MPTAKCLTPVVALATLCIHAGCTAADRSQKPAMARQIVPVAAEVHGTLPPELAGTWLWLSHTETRRGHLNGWGVLRFTHNDSRWEVTRLSGVAAPPLAAALSAANVKHEIVVVDAEVLAAVRATLPELTQSASARAEQCILTAAPSLRPAVRAAHPTGKFSIEFVASGRGGHRAATSYVAEEVESNVIRGAMGMGAVAVAGAAVVPVGVSGSFTMYRLE